MSAVLFDLDDTLFLQRDWLRGAWRAVAAHGATVGLPEAELHAALETVAAEGSDRGCIIDRALAMVGARDVDVAPLVSAFLRHRAPLSPLPAVRDGLRFLRRCVLIGLVSDGNPDLQRAKLDALGLTKSFDVVVLSDELDRHRRKPDPAPFRAALRALDTDPADAVFVGDRPDKDGVGAAAVGMRFVRVLTGEYRAAPDRVTPWLTTPSVTDALPRLLAHHAGAR